MNQFNENQNILLSEFINTPQEGKLADKKIMIEHSWDSVWIEEMKDFATIRDSYNNVNNPPRPYTKKAEDEFISNGFLISSKPAQFWAAYISELRYLITLAKIKNSTKNSIKLPYDKAMIFYQQALENGNIELIQKADSMLITAVTEYL